MTGLENTQEALKQLNAEITRLKLIEKKLVNLTNNDFAYTVDYDRHFKEFHGNGIEYGISIVIDKLKDILEGK